ncbi:MAG: hypothetical protein Q9160_000569 [Pyrenula sp. 1 TL-2023]
MAEDGMLLNFAPEKDDAANYRSKFRGGSWKERMVAKKKANHYERKGKSGRNTQDIDGGQKISDAAKSIQEKDDQLPNQRPTKRPRLEEGSQAVRTSAQSRRHLQEDRQRKSPKEQEVISSLFTYNPKPSLEIHRSEKPDAQSAHPSNAPLLDGIDTFTSLGLMSSLAAHLLTKMDLKVPTAIQKASIAQVLKEDSDVFIQSETGSGKTLAYLLPLVQKIMSLSDDSVITNSTTSNGKLNRGSGLFAIILAPTRELCKQISVVLERLLGCAHWIVAGSVTGGERKKSEKARLRKGLNILVATPGRLADHLDNTKVLDVGQVKWLVLDEGDRLMDLGFEEDILKIVRKLELSPEITRSIHNLPSRRTTILCSATMKMNVQRLGEISLKDAVLVQADSNSTVNPAQKDAHKEQVFSAPAQLKQSYAIVPAKLRLISLIAFLKRNFARKGSVMKAIVFVSCADSVDFHFEILTHNFTNLSATTNTEDSTTQPPPPNTSSTSSHDPSTRPSPLLSPTLTLHKLHGSLPQSTRTSIVTTFSRSTTPSLLIATDVASRGLDLPNLDLVLEYDPAFSADDHLHRIGRTARLGRDGRAMIFLMPGPEEGYVEVLRRSYRDAGEGGAHRVAHVGGEEMLRRGFASGLVVGKMANGEARERAQELQLNIERLIASSSAAANQKYAELARRAFQSHVRAYATHIAAERKYFDIKSLHLGHLAKAFGLRDRPGNVNVGVHGKEKRETRGGEEGKRMRNGESGEVESRGKAIAKGKGQEDVEEAKVKMRRKMREQMKGAGEFNIA